MKRVNLSLSDYSGSIYLFQRRIRKLTPVNNILCKLCVTENGEGTSLPIHRKAFKNHTCQTAQKTVF